MLTFISPTTNVTQGRQVARISVLLLSIGILVLSIFIFFKLAMQRLRKFHAVSYCIA